MPYILPSRRKTLHPFVCSDRAAATRRCKLAEVLQVAYLICCASLQACQYQLGHGTFAGLLDDGGIATERRSLHLMTHSSGMDLIYLAALPDYLHLRPASGVLH